MLMITNENQLNKYRKKIYSQEEKKEDWYYVFDDDNVIIDMEFNPLNETYITNNNFMGKNITFKYYSNVNKIFLTGNLSCVDLRADKIKVKGNVFAKELYVDNLECDNAQGNLIDCKDIKVENNIKCDTLKCGDLLMYKKFKLKELFYKNAFLCNISSSQ